MAGRKRSDYYKARHSFGVMHDGEQITVNEGEIVPSDSSLIKQFSSAAVEEHFVEVTSFGRWDVVEQATAAPGEKRGAEEHKAAEKQERTEAPSKLTEHGR